MKSIFADSLRRGAAVAIGIVMLSAASVAAQEEDPEVVLNPIPHEEVGDPVPIDDGLYSGGISYGISMIRGDEGATLLFMRDGIGTAEFEVVNGTIDGTWSSTESGDLTFPDQLGVLQTELSAEATGTLSGSFPYLLTGVFTTTAEATVDTGVGSATSDPTTQSVEMVFQLEQIDQACGQVLASWDTSLSDLMVSEGWTPAVQTQLAVFEGGVDNSLTRRVSELIAQASFVTSANANGELLVAFMSESIAKAEAIMSEILSWPDNCPQDQKFLRLVNQVLRNLANSLLDNWTNTEYELPMVRQLVVVGLRAGIIGSGAVDEEAASYLEEKIGILLDTEYNSIPEGGGTEAQRDDLRQAILISEIMGQDLSTGQTNAELCASIGGC